MITQSQIHFEPYIKKLSFGGYSCSFFYGTPQAKEWYDPLKPYTLLEYEWVLKHINLKNEKIIDVGAHHGQYTLVFSLGSDGKSDIIAVDPVSSNTDLIRINLSINNVQACILQCVASDKEGHVQFNMISNGRIVDDGGVSVVSRRLPSIMPDATIVKLDVEGAEFLILPDQIDDMLHVHTWIVEIHPHAGRNPQELVQLFKQRGYHIRWVNRDKNVVEPYPKNPSWKTHTTLFFWH